MKITIRRDDVIAIINYKNLSQANRNFIIEEFKKTRLIGDSDLETLIICKDKSYMVSKSPKFIMNRLNKSLFLTLKEA